MNRSEAHIHPTAKNLEVVVVHVTTAEDKPVTTGAAAAEESGVNDGSRRAFSVCQFCRRYGVGRTTAYAEIAAGRLRAVKVGHRTLITNDAAEAWLASLPELRRPDAARAK